MGSATGDCRRGPHTKRGAIIICLDVITFDLVVSETRIRSPVSPDGHKATELATDYIYYATRLYLYRSNNNNAAVVVAQRVWSRIGRALTILLFYCRLKFS